MFDPSGWSSLIAFLPLRNGDQVAPGKRPYTGTIAPVRPMMNPVGKAIWFIESHFSGEISLDEIAQAAGVSRYHMVRAFGYVTGLSVMRYVRGRRLTEAARSLSHGAPDILAVALDAGYGSHEAFTRAFRDQFGLTPEAVRARGHSDNLALVELLKMDETLLTDLNAPRFENGRPLLVAGLGERYTWETGKAIPAQWQRFAPYIGNIPARSARRRTASAATATTRATSTTSRASRSPISPSYRRA
jgi:AraC family transcriptional regulator